MTTFHRSKRGAGWGGRRDTGTRKLSEDLYDLFCAKRIDEGVDDSFEDDERVDEEADDDSSLERNAEERQRAAVGARQRVESHCRHPADQIGAWYSNKYVNE